MLEKAGKDHLARLNKCMLLPSAQESSVSSTGLPDLAKIGGLSEEKARRWLKQEGPNELTTSRKRSLFHIAFSVLRDLFAFSLPSPLGLLWCLEAGIASLLWFEALKVVTRRYVRHG